MNYTKTDILKIELWLVLKQYNLTKPSTYKKTTLKTTKVQKTEYLKRLIASFWEGKFYLQIENLNLIFMPSVG